MLNLACSDRTDVGFLDGHYYFLVGDSASGKTFLSLTCMAEAANDSRYDEYRFIYDNAEDGALMDMPKFFGRKMSDRLEPPRRSKEGLPFYSSTIEEFYYHLDDAFKAGKPFIYVLDSMDSISSEDEIDKFQKKKKSFKKSARGEEAPKVAGSFGDGKAKKNSANLRQIVPKLSSTGSILIVINQTRDNVGVFSFEKKTRSGGHALRFYATLEIWSSIVEKMTKTVRGKKRKIGIVSQLQVKKNRLTGKETKVDVPIYWSTGIDDIGSCIDFLVDEEHWSDKEGKLEASEFDFVGKKEDLVTKIESEGREKDLHVLVGELWNEIQVACQVKRKKRYQ